MIAGSALTIEFAPQVPLVLLVVLTVLSAMLLTYSAFRSTRGVILRGAALATGILTLANPAVIQEERESLTDVAVVVADVSASQRVSDRSARTESTLKQVEQNLEVFENLDVRVIRAGNEEDANGTRLFGALERALADVQPDRVAATILLTDGQVHDAPDATALDGKSWRGVGEGPVHVLLTGERTEGDRRLVIERAPAFGVVGDRLSLAIRVEDSAGSAGLAVLRVLTDGSTTPRTLQIPIGVTTEIPFILEHGGPTVVELETEPGPQELTLSNNRAAIVVNGVRDRLRVMLVSGEPHAGERTWRNLLKADPSVDLIHFTILRPPGKQDATPIRELSLISFPVRELFEQRLADFDLIIFDRYRQRGVIPHAYMQNVADYVVAGGAVLEAAGPEFATALSLYATPIAAVLPGRPTGVTEAPFRPRVSTLGLRHPVTADLPGATDENPEWGRWFRIVDAVRIRGNILMEGDAGRPLLILDRFGQGRVAQLLSDQAWLWARGFEGGGPQAELLRRLAHWLMKEPELEEEALLATSTGQRLEIMRRTINPDPARHVTVTAPDGNETVLQLDPARAGRWTTTLLVQQTGLYRLTDGEFSTIAAVGVLNSREYADLRTTEAALRPVVKATDGGIYWLAESGTPEVRRVRAGRNAAGRTWMGIPENDSYLVTGIRKIPLIPGILALLLLTGTLVGAWVREGQ